MQQGYHLGKSDGEVQAARSQKERDRVVGSGIMVIGQLVEEKKIGVLDIWKSIQCNEEVACERTEMEEIRQ